MHTTGLRTHDFEITVDGRTAALDDVFPGFDEQDRLGIVIHDHLGAAGAGSLILAAVTAFYDQLRAGGEPFFAYADFFAFHVGADHGTLRKLDVYPAHKEVTVDNDAERILDEVMAEMPPTIAPGAATTLMTDPDVPTAVTGPPLTEAGKPEVLYVATGYCPYCAAENWALIVALSRFGQFTGLTTSRSPQFEDVPPIDTWTFYGSSYTSPYLAFVPVETRSNVLVSPKANKEDAASYRVLQHLTAAQQAVFNKYDNQRSTPFVDFAGQAVQTGSGILANLVANNTWQQLAADLRHPETLEGATLLNEADTLTAELCSLTARSSTNFYLHRRPGATCSPALRPSPLNRPASSASLPWFSSGGSARASSNR